MAALRQPGQSGPDRVVGEQCGPGRAASPRVPPEPPRVGVALLPAALPSRAVDAAGARPAVSQPGVHPDGRWIVTAANSDYIGSGAGEWTIWDAATGRMIESRPGQGVRKVAIDPTGTRLAVGSAPGPGQPGMVTLWKGTTTDGPPQLGASPIASCGLSVG